ncbi:MAG: FAD-binding protein, partial [Cyclobacteriaceae bacterium]
MDGFNKKSVTLTLSPEEAFDEVRFQHFVKRELGVASSSDVHFKLLRRSIDARGKRTKVHLSG